MSEFPITATYVESAEYHLDRLKYLPRQKGKGKFYVAWTAIVGLMYLHAWVTGNTPVLVRIAVTAGFILLLVAALPHVWRWWVRRMINKKLANQTHTVKWEFRDEDIQLYTSKVSTRYDWNYVTKVVQNPEGFQLFSSATHFHWIPKTSLAPPEDYVRLAELLTRKVPVFERR